MRVGALPGLDERPRVASSARISLRLRLLRLLVYSGFGCYGVAALAAVSCEQLADVALTTQRLRDQGYSLNTLLMEFDQPAMSSAFPATEILRIKEVVQQVFTSERSPVEILQECKASPGAADRPGQR